MSTVLVTGGAGFIGSALVIRLVCDGVNVRLVDDFSRGHPRRLASVKGQFESINADVRDVEALTRAATGVDQVIHLAAINGTAFFYQYPERVLDVGVRGMLAVIDACRNARVRRLVVASSAEVYQTPAKVPTDESVSLSIPDVLNARYSYGGSKIASELIALNYGRTGFDNVTIFRPHNVYGPDMGWEHVLPQLVLKAHTAVSAHPRGPVSLPIEGDGRQTRAFVFIDDCVDGIVKLAEKGKHLNIYHIGSSEEVTIAELAKRVLQFFGREVQLVPLPEPLGATPRRCPDISKMRGLGYAPKVNLQNGLPRLAAWYVENAHLQPKTTA